MKNIQQSKKEEEPKMKEVSKKKTTAAPATKEDKNEFPLVAIVGLCIIDDGKPYKF